MEAVEEQQQFTIAFAFTHWLLPQAAMSKPWAHEARTGSNAKIAGKMRKATAQTNELHGDGNASGTPVCRV